MNGRRDLLAELLAVKGADDPVEAVTDAIVEVHYGFGFPDRLGEIDGTDGDASDAARLVHEGSLID